MADKRHSRPSRGYQGHSGREAVSLPTLSQYGMSVFRRISPGDLDEPLAVFSEHTKDMTHRQRGEGIDFESALMLVSVNETRRNKQIGHVPVKEAIDSVYGVLRDLRRSRPVELGKVGLFGAKGAPMVTIGYHLDGPDSLATMIERKAVIGVLQDFAPDERADEDDWHIHYTTHLSLGKVSSEFLQLPGRMAAITRDLDAARPESVMLQRATLHDPSTASNSMPLAS